MANNTFSRSWEITKVSFNVIKQDKELLWYPVLSAILSLALSVALFFPTIIVNFLEGATDFAFFGMLQYVMIFVDYLGIAFIATFFNVCVVYTAKKRFKGQNAKFGESIRFAFSKIILIFLWSLLSATVGLVMKILDNIAQNMQGIGEIIIKIINGIFGLLWSISTIFVIQAMVYKDLRPFPAIQSSVKTLKKTWGESILRYFGLGLIQGLVIFVGLIAAVILGFLVFALGIIPLLIVIAAFIVYVIIVSLVFKVAEMVYNTALYVYADTGKTPKGYSKSTMEEAFRSKRGKVRA